MKEMSRNFDAENDYFQEIRMRNNELSVKNASDPGRLLLTQAAALEAIGDNVEGIDAEHGEEGVRITLVQKIETKSYIVQQGRNRVQGQEIMTVYTKTGVEIDDMKSKEFKGEFGQPKVCSNQGTGTGCMRRN